MNILATSDLHGEIRAFKNLAHFSMNNDVDLVIIAGDITSYDSSGYYDHIISILSNIKKTVLFLMGNDDEFEWQSQRNLININQRSFKHKDYTFIGYQYTNPFVGGLFEKSEDEQQNDLTKLKENISDNTILITHGPCYGILDKPDNINSVGSKSLLNFYI